MSGFIDIILVATLTWNHEVQIHECGCLSPPVDHKKAGEAELSVTVSSPVGRNLPLEVKPVGDTRAELVEFHPPCPGKYKLAIWYGDEEVPGSPVVIVCEEEGGARAYGEGLSRGRVGVPATFHIQAQGLGEPHVQVDGPDSVAKSSITAEDEDGLYAVSYIPQEVGIFDVTVMWNGKELPGQFEIGFFIFV